MPRKRRSSVPSYMDEDDYNFEEKYDKEEDFDTRAPRNAANARERARMRVLSKAFCRLKTTLPWVPADTKLSKLDTLRLAATYIAHLRAVLRDDGDHHSETTKSLSLTLSWPFAIQSAGIPIMTNGDCDMSSSSSISPRIPEYQSHQNPQRQQNLHHLDHQSLLRCDNHDSHISNY
ncbi:twist-related protein [Belonocnema kinseyi]|uniref:twist-related protein n=1 Tax=Belonocnema kinseyi TaxID=2817044 RepID=UPI00143DF249|nr:twist-related protein [Belonocnema kinseyi]XP_033213054.1 twist-related protein [Belonocnema kinseyi]